jgi:thiol-disulfide isomerase/thioredoxin
MTIRKFACLFLIALAAVAGCEQGKLTGGSGSAANGSGSPKPAAAPTVSAAPAATEVTLKPLKIKQIRELIDSKKGKVVVIDAWSTYCEPCMKEFPGLLALDKKYGRDKIACISLCLNFQGLDSPTDPSVFDEPFAFLKSQNATIDNVICADSDSALYEQWKFPTVPAVFVFDREGKEVKRFLNEFKYSDIEAFVAPMLK